MAEKHAPKLMLALLAVCAALTGCDGDSIDTAPADYERAKLDCQPHGGLQSVTTALVVFRDTRVDAFCANGARISRPAIAGQPAQGGGA